MDGSPRLAAPALLVVRGFAGMRQESQLLAAAYDRLLPVALDSRCGMHPATGAPATDRGHVGRRLSHVNSLPLAAESEA